MSPLRLLLLPGAVLLLTGCPDKKESAAGAGKSGGMPPVPVNVATAVKKDVPLDVRTFGNVEPIASVAIKAQVGGDLIGVHFTEGEEVEAKKLLFTIQPRLYETQRDQAKANLDRDRALAANAVLALKRQEALDTKGSGIKEELEKARTLEASTAATVRADEALLLIAETQVGYTTIEAPMAGRTGSIRLREGNLIRVGDEQPLTTIVQMAPIHVAFALPEQHLDAIRRGLSGAKNELIVTARDSKDGRTLGEGHVTFLANTVDTTTGTVALKAEFDNKDRALWPGAFVDVSLRLSTDSGVVVVPSSAVTVSQRGTQVYIVKDDGTADPRPVTVLRTAGQESIIKEGVAAGETVISNGQSRVLPGGKVVPKPPPDTPAPGAPAGKRTSSLRRASPPASGVTGRLVDLQWGPPELPTGAPSTALPAHMDCPAGPHGLPYRPTWMALPAHMVGATGPHGLRYRPTWTALPAHMDCATGPHGPRYRPTWTALLARLDCATGPVGVRYWPGRTALLARLDCATGPVGLRYWPGRTALLARLDRPTGPVGPRYWLT